jgi:predicted CoA-binding protein
MIEERDVEAFLASDRIAVVGASDDPKNFGRTIYTELKVHGHEVVAVNPNADVVAGDPCFASLADVPDPVDAVFVIVPADRAAGVVRDAAAIGATRVWLFQGIGGTGSVSPEAVAAAREHGLTLIAGACPLMFLEPVAWFHRMHRRLRQMRGAVGPVG